MRLDTVALLNAASALALARSVNGQLLEGNILTVDLDRPGASSVEEWASVSELRRWADLLQSGWGPTTLGKLRTALASNALSLTHSTIRADGVTREYADYASLAEWVRRDVENTHLADLRALLLAEDNNHLDSYNHGPASDTFAFNAFDSATTPTIAFEVGVCGPLKVRKVHIGFGACGPLALADTRASPLYDYATDVSNGVYSFESNPLMDAYSMWMNKTAPLSQGFTSCSRSCRDNIVRISDAWSLKDPMGNPTRIAIFSPYHVSECTALHLLTSSKFFGIPGPSPLSLDKANLWTDDRVALMTGDPQSKLQQCFVNIDAAIQDLPIKDRAAMSRTDPWEDCAIALDELDWKTFAKLYEEFILLDADSQTWPTFSRIFNAYINNESLWNSTLGALPCTDWSKWSSLHPIKDPPPKIPILNLQGPPVSSLSDLIHLSLKFSSGDPSRSKPLIPEAHLDAFAQLCTRCRSVPRISLHAIFRASREVGALTCRNTILGGRGAAERLNEFLSARAQELERVMLGLRGATAVTFERSSERVSGDEIHFQGEGKDGVGAEGGAGVGVLGGLFGGKEVSDQGRFVNVTGGEAILYFDRCLASNRLQFSLPLTLLNLKFSVGRKNLKVVYLNLSHNVSIPFEASDYTTDEYRQVRGPSEYSIKTYDRWIEVDGFEEEAVIKFSNDGSHLEMDVGFKRDVVGRIRMGVGFNFEKATKIDEFTIPVICGYSPEVDLGTIPFIPIPHTNTLSDLLSTNSEGISAVSAPLRYHVATYDLKSQSENTPFLTAQVSFLAGQTSLLALQGSRHLPLNDANPLQLPASLKGKLTLTDPCDSGAFGANIVSGGRLVYRNDLVSVESCLETSVVDVEDAIAVLAPGAEIPVVSLVTSKKDKNQKILVFNVNWLPREYASHSREAKLLLFLMEYFRITLGHPMVVAGKFDDSLGNVLKIALEETGTWTSFFSPSTGSIGSYVWAPYVPPIDATKHIRDPSIRHAPVVYITPVESCLAPSNYSGTFSSCEPLKDYGKAFRKAYGGIVAEDRLLAKHTACANDISVHVPVVYTLFKAGEQVSIVTFNIGGLSLSRIRALKSHLFVYLSSFDVVLLQTTRSASDKSWHDELEEEYDAELVAAKVSELLTAELIASVEGKMKLKTHEVAFQHHSKLYTPSKFASTTAGSAANHLHIFYKEFTPKKAGVAKRLEMLNCTSEIYGYSSGIVGCIFAVQQSELFILSTLDDSVYVEGNKFGGRYSPITSMWDSTGQDRSGFIPPVVSSSILSPLTSPDYDLPNHNINVMKRLYLGLCLMQRWNPTETDCNQYPVTAAFAGTWGWSESFKRDGKRAKVNGTFADFKSFMGSVEKEIIRKNQVGDLKFPGGHNSKLRVRTIVPSERASRDYLRLLFDEEPSSGLYGWFSGGKGSSP
ncbi:hypothetical protein BC830DRAFT_1091242 [Chytriomyces sp. MP71]|nr:hypothetical protein BC830DRAFT_1091242 [Chytriomyces sp. MP71]